jgi:ABC-type multidrug transport system fused ATPase/permease subunit
MTRSILVTETYIKATEACISNGNESAAVTLMSTDIERIDMGLRALHEIWASVIQAAVAGWMLYGQLGIVFLAPMVVVLISFVSLAVMMKFTGDTQKPWMAGVQKRVGLTATVIASMKNLKISGLTTVAGEFVQKLRIDELEAGSRFRKILILAALFGFTPMLIGPPITFAFAQRSLDTTKIFTSLSYLSLLTNPLSQIFQSIPNVISALTCIGRIQTFLECETRQDFRKFLTDTMRNSEKPRGDSSVSPSSEVELADPITVKDGSFGWEADKFVLQNVNTRVSRSSLTMVVGPVGSGKSTLCKALLGETPFNKGSTVLSTRFPHVGFCDQTAFLWNGSIRDNIIGFSSFDSQRYAEVIEATALAVDFNTIRQGDRTNVGSDGITLSGGQSQRVSLARSLYLQSDLLVLDDIFSGLDADTEEQVFQQVFGAGGLLKRRRSTVVLCTHSIRHLPAADYIIALEGGTIVEQGRFDELMARSGYVQRLGLKSLSESEASSDTATLRKRMSGSKPRLIESKPATDASDPTLDTSGARQVGDLAVYKQYFKSMGLLLAGCTLLFAVLLGFFANFSTICESFRSSVFKAIGLGHATNAPVYRAHILVRWCFHGQSNSHVLLLRWDIRSAPDILHAVTASSLYLHLHCFCEQSRCQSTPVCFANTHPSTTAVLHQHRHRCYHQSILTRSESY